MLIVISPAKTLDFESEAQTKIATRPLFPEKSEVLIKKLRTLSKKKLMSLMSISKDLADLNAERYINWGAGDAIKMEKQALLAFKGDVYLGLEAENFSDSDFEYAQKHLRILSGLYGVLRPMDVIQPYRLEMGSKLKSGRKKDLYDFWDSQITEHLNAAFEEGQEKYLINLASQEYFGAVKPAMLDAEVITPTFLDKKGAEYKVVSFWAKKARGIMTAWLISNRIESPEELKSFDLAGYVFNAELTDGNRLAFTRDIPQ